jgi:hypothetical protein
MDILTRFQHLDSLHGVPVERDEQWGYALTMARDDYKDDIELIPNLRPLHNGADVIGPDRTYYMGGVRNRLGLGQFHPPMHGLFSEHISLDRLCSIFPIRCHD